MLYLWLKSFHLLTVVLWMATVFALPVVLECLTAAGEDEPGRARLHQLGRRLYRFGHNVFGVAVALGLVLWLGWRWWPTALPNIVGSMAWIHAKLTLLVFLLAYFVWAGRALKRHIAGGTLPAATTLRRFNAIPVVLLLAVIVLVLVKPF